MVPYHNKYSTGNGAHCNVMLNREHLPCSNVNQGQNDKRVQPWPLLLLRRTEQIRRLSARERATLEGDSTCYARNNLQSSTVEADEEGLSTACSEEQSTLERKETTNAREMHKKHNDPGGEHNINSCFEIATLHLF